jgi:hypothetical protein
MTFINILCGQNTDLLVIKSGGMQVEQYALIGFNPLSYKMYTYGCLIILLQLGASSGLTTVNSKLVAAY